MPKDKKDKKRKSNASSPKDVKKAKETLETYPSWRDHQGLTVARLQCGQSLLFVGQATLQVLQGCIDVAGTLLTADSAPVKLSTGGRHGLAIPLAAHPVSQQVPLATNEITEVTLQAPPLDYDEEHPVTFQLYLPENPVAPAATLTPPDWHQAVTSVLESASAGAWPPVIVVCGSKGVGKSTLSRYLVNQLLNQHPVVGYLDSDCGQPELTPPGLVSLTHLDQPLLGPAHVHLQHPHRAHFLGDTSPQCHPELYVSAVAALHRWYTQSAAGPSGQWPPLVINMHGWIKGLGYDMLCDILRSINPSHLLQVRMGSDNKNLPRGCFWADASQKCTTQVLSVDSPVPAVVTGAVAAGQASPGPLHSEPGTAAGSQGAKGPRSLKPVEKRGLQWHAWAKASVGWDGTWGSYEADDFYQNATALAAATPWEVSLDEVTIQFLYTDLPPEQQGYALNGMVVGLCTGVSPAAAGSAQLHQPGVAGTSEPLVCVGLGIVRAVDMSQRRLYLLTTVAEEVLEQVAVLQVGKTDLPTSLQQTSALAPPYLTLFSMPTDACGATAGKSRKNITRTGLVATLGA